MFIILYNWTFSINFTLVIIFLYITYLLPPAEIAATRSRDTLHLAETPYKESRSRVHLTKIPYGSRDTLHVAEISGTLSRDTFTCSRDTLRIAEIPCT